MKKIEFHPVNELTEKILDAPVPASKTIPDWFKRTDGTVRKEYNHRNPDNTANKSVKLCVPFIDALTTGYMITLPCDVVFVDPKKYDGKRVLWDVSWQMLEAHTPGQLGMMPIPSGYDSAALKWTVMWSIKTPPGYSLMFTHPLNRFDLPFLTFSGVVDTDRYEIPVNLPFFIREDFMGKIEKGTPIAQIIPIKRERWNSIKEKFTNKHNFLIDSLRTVIDHSYRLRWWSKKTYD